MATLTMPRAARAPAALADVARFRLLAGIPFALGVLLSFLGFAWDVQWHSDVGPDTFFTAPHLVLYSGVALTGLTCLAVVLVTTAWVRRGIAGAAEGTIPVLFGTFRGPVGFVVGGVGAAMFLLYGLTDQWWHSLYGFDVTLISPPHVGLILSLLISMIGCLVAFATEARRAADRGVVPVGAALGVAVAAAILLAFVTPTPIAFFHDEVGPLFGRIDGAGIVVAALYPATLLMVAAILRQPGAATLTALVFTALRLATWHAIPWVTREYAASIDLFLRDNTSGRPVVPGMMPAYLLVAGVAVDLLLLAARRRHWDLRLVVPVAGAVAAFLLRLLEPTLPALMPDPSWWSADGVNEVMATIAAMKYPTLLVTPFIGAVAGRLGWLLGIVVRGQVASAVTASVGAERAGDAGMEERQWVA